MAFVFRRPRLAAQRASKRRAQLLVLGAPGVVNLIGVTATGIAAALATANDASSLGVAATGSVGSLTPNPKGVVAGAVGVSGVGQLSLSSSVLVVGVAGADAVGSAAPLVADLGLGIQSVGAVGQLFNAGPTVGISGAVGTGAAGVLARTVTISLSGVQGAVAVGAAGGLIANLGLGVAGIGMAGLFTFGLVKTLPGAFATSIAGVLAKAVARAVAGVSATGRAGNLTTGRTAVIIGVRATGAAGQLVGIQFATVRLSAPLIAAITASESAEVLLELITLDHWSLAEPVRIVNDPRDLVSRGKTFIGAPITLEKPARSDRTPSGRITVPNTDKRIGMVIEAIDEPLSVTIEVVLASSPDVVEEVVTGLKLRGATIDAISASGEITATDWSREPWPSRAVVTQAAFPGAFRS